MAVVAALASLSARSTGHSPTTDRLPAWKYRCSPDALTRRDDHDLRSRWRRDRGLPGPAARGGPARRRRGDPPHARLRPGDQGDRAPACRRGLRRHRARTCTTARRPAPPGRCRRRRPGGRRGARRAAGRRRGRRAATTSGRLPTANGKIGVIGYCSGGRQTLPGGLLACRSTPPSTATALSSSSDAAGGHAGDDEPDPAIWRRNLRCPLLGLFGDDDNTLHPIGGRAGRRSDRAGQAPRVPRYDGAGHSFFSVDRPAYRLEAAATAGS